ncbi:MAG TPA: alpha-L-rhamnosidase C-terminal domain-containing protein [Kiritimatiellia bacterium]|nr:alpha-L-rhamnosidase C-terminal domain-containing protein [Kiritimatiellia bacterium]
MSHTDSSRQESPFDGRAHWIWTATPDAPRAGSVAVSAQFRRRFTAPPGATLTLRVSADSAWRLRLDGEIVARGTARGDPAHWPYDTWTWPLTEGDHALTAEVVCFAASWPDYAAGGAPVWCMAQRPGFIADAALRNAAGGCCGEFFTDDSWEAALMDDMVFVARPGVPCAGPGEEARAPEANPRWQPAHRIAPGVAADTVVDSPLPYRLEPRGVSNPRLGAQRLQLVRPALLELAPGDRGDWLFDAGVYCTGHPRLRVEGAGTLTLAYGERLSRGDVAVRDPSEAHDPLEGPMRDTLHVARGPVEWEPFFRRSFRYIRLTAVAGNLPLRISVEDVRTTGYAFADPLPFSSSDPAHRVLEEISRRTLCACAHETFEDCPYYEEMQYAGDVHMQARTAFWMAGDTRLARQALRQFAASVNAEGLTASRWPSRIPQLIPLWSLHWILALWEYVLHAGDRDLIEECRPAVEVVLAWFRRRRAEDGLIHRIPYWMFADWSPQWPMGVPPGAGTTPSALVHFLWIAALRAAGACAGGSLGEAWQGEADEAAARCRSVFRSPGETLFRDTPAPDAPRSKLANAWAILAGVCTPREAGPLADALASAPNLAEPALFGRAFLFDSYLKAGRPAWAEHLLSLYAEMARAGFTTWPEEPDALRSECHGWSNLPGHAFRRLYLGLEILEPGGSRIRVAPWPGALTQANGGIPLPHGTLHVAWTKAPDGRAIELRLLIPEGTRVEVPNHSESLSPGRHHLNLPLA